MKRQVMCQRLSLAAIVGGLVMSLASASAAVTASKELPDGGQFTVDGGTLRIQFWSETIVRITYAAGELPTIKSLSVVASPAAPQLTRQEIDQAFTLYEDEDDSYRYENGAFATIPFAWDDAAKTLTIGERKGDFRGMLKERTFNVVWVSANHGEGISVTEKPDAVVHYNGKAVMIPGTK